VIMPGVNQRPYVLLSCAMSVDGYIDDTSSDRLLLSNAPVMSTVKLSQYSCVAVDTRSLARYHWMPEAGMYVYQTSVHAAEVTRGGEPQPAIRCAIGPGGVAVAGHDLAGACPVRVLGCPPLLKVVL
jgi:5-amino-6-(5-phosphoribosylamino)uracil reductase